jgi:hypothetical protein
MPVFPEEMEDIGKRIMVLGQPWAKKPDPI